MYSKIVNPKTGRKVSVGGRLGRDILRWYLIVLRGGVGTSQTPEEPDNKPAINSQRQRWATRARTEREQVCVPEKMEFNNFQKCVSACNSVTPEVKSKLDTCINKAQNSARDIAYKKKQMREKTADDMAEGKLISTSPLDDAKKNAKLRRSIDEGRHGRRMFHKPLKMITREDKGIDLSQLE